jgi:hypothetical protein
MILAYPAVVTTSIYQALTYHEQSTVTRCFYLASQLILVTAHEVSTSPRATAQCQPDLGYRGQHYSSCLHWPSTFLECL